MNRIITIEGTPICVDFDGTVVEHKYPEIGPPVPYALSCLRTLQDSFGVKIILWTMRSGSTLIDAVEYLEANKIILFGVNKNPDQCGWTTSPKAYAPCYIDDAAVGCPLIFPEDGRRPYVDWMSVMDLFHFEGILVP